MASVGHSFQNLKEEWGQVCDNQAVRVAIHEFRAARLKNTVTAAIEQKFMEEMTSQCTRTASLFEKFKSCQDLPFNSNTTWLANPEVLDFISAEYRVAPHRFRAMLDKQLSVKDVMDELKVRINTNAVLKSFPMVLNLFEGFYDLAGLPQFMS